MSLEIGQRIAEEILRNQARKQQAVADKTVATWKELPRPLSYYYRPHQYATISSKTTQTLFDFTLRKNHVLWIMQVASNWWETTWSEWKVDGEAIDKVERWISNINTPLVIKDRYLLAYKNVQWIVHNDSQVQIIAEVLIDGVVYHLDDWKKMNRVFTI